MAAWKARKEIASELLVRLGLSSLSEDQVNARIHDILEDPDGDIMAFSGDVLIHGRVEGGDLCQTVKDVISGKILSRTRIPIRVMRRQLENRIEKELGRGRR